MKLAALALLALASCQTPAGSFSLPPDPGAVDAAPVVGHWNLDTWPGEHLWIEADATFTEAGGPPLSAGSLTGILSAGAWTFAAPSTLTFEDAHTGEHIYSATVDKGSSLTLRDAAHSYHFEWDPADAGSD